MHGQQGTQSVQGPGPDQDEDEDGLGPVAVSTAPEQKRTKIRRAVAEAATGDGRVKRGGTNCT